MDKVIKLEWYEQNIAKLVGRLRQKHSLNYDKHVRGKPSISEEKQIALDIEAAGAEIAAAKVYKVYFHGSVDAPKHLPDIGERIQVRHTRPHNNRLIVTPDADDDQFYVLVTGEFPEYVVRGHILARDAKQERWLSNPNNRTPAYFVPQEALCKPKERKR